MTNNSLYSRPNTKSLFSFNQSDIFVLVIFFGLVSGLIFGAMKMSAPYQLGEHLEISLSPWMLPSYALRTIIRMGIALLLSLLFTFTIATLAAKNRSAERFIIPMIDVMQSVPVLGFLSITILAFIYLFPGSLLGPECAAIFAIFTSQVWNMALSFYQSLRTVPKDLREAASMFHLSPWQRFWRLEVPFATPSLIWNTMMSLSAGWFFVVASEAISVNNQNIHLPGIGSYIMMATKTLNYPALAWVILTMFIVILIYDQLIFRPLIAWSEKFKLDSNPSTETEAWFLNLLQKAHVTFYMMAFFRFIRDLITRPFFRRRTKHVLPSRVQQALSWTVSAFWNSVIFLTLAASITALGYMIYSEIKLNEIFHVLYLGLVTALKVCVLIILCSCIWVPVGVFIALRPRLAGWVQPFIQFLASFPVNLVYPLVYMLIVSYGLSVNIWTAPLMILGTQWYILFNVIAGMSTLPQDFHLVARNYGLKGFLWWRKLILPGIFPFYVTGAMTAAGGCWNASIVSEVVNWGDQTLLATGLGAYITQHTTTGDFPRIGLGIAVMSLYVIVINRLLWHKLYEFAESRYQIVG